MAPSRLDTAVAVCSLCIRGQSVDDWVKLTVGLFKRVSGASVLVLARKGGSPLNLPVSIGPLPVVPGGADVSTSNVSFAFISAMSERRLSCNHRSFSRNVSR